MSSCAAVAASHDPETFVIVRIDALRCLAFASVRTRADFYLIAGAGGLFGDAAEDALSQERPEVSTELGALAR